MCSYVNWLCVQQHFCVVCLSVLHHFSAFAFFHPLLSIAICPVACLSVSSCYSTLWTGRHGNLRMPTQTCWTCLYHPRIIKPTLRSSTFTYRTSLCPPLPTTLSFLRDMNIWMEEEGRGKNKGNRKLCMVQMWSRKFFSVTAESMKTAEKRRELSSVQHMWRTQNTSS